MASAEPIGRAAEAAVLAGAVAAVRAGGRASVVVVGEAGVGKTTLWADGVAKARDAGLEVLVAQPAEPETAMPFAGLGDLLDGCLVAAAAGLPAVQRRALEAALSIGEPDDAGPPAPRAVGVAARNALRALAERGPVALAIDDLHWLDADSARVLAFALRRLDDAPVLLLATRRPEPDTPELRALRERPAAAEIVLEGLGRAELFALLRDRLGLVLTPPTLDRLYAATRGNPLHALEIGRLLAHEPPTDDPLAELPIPPSLQAALAERLAVVSPAARALLGAAAALGRPTREDLAGFGADALREVRRAGIVGVDGASVRFAHPLFASVAYAELAAAERRAIHRRLSATGVDPEVRAVHLAQAVDGPDARAAEVVATAAERAAARGAPDAALRLALHARRLTPPDDDVTLRTRTLAAADRAFDAGDTALARRLLEPLTSAGDADALVRSATLATYDGTMDDARALACAALAAPTLTAATRILAQRRVALTHLLQARLAEAEAHAAIAVGLAGAQGDPATHSAALANLAYVRALRGDAAAADADLAAARTGAAALDDAPEAIAGLLAMYVGQYAEARRRLEAVLAETAAAGGEARSTGVLFALSELATRSGRFADGLALAVRGLDASEHAGQRTELTVLLFVRALAEAHLGDVVAAREHARAGLVIADEAGHRFAAAQNRWALGAAELSAGAAEAAWDALGDVLVFLRTQDVRLPGVVAVHADAVEAAVACGHTDAAAAGLADLEAGGGPPGVVAWLRGVVSGAQGDREASTSLDAAIAQLRADERPYELARALLAGGIAHRRRKARGAARALLDEAATRFDALGAAGWAARARSEQARVAGRRAATDRDALTDAERRIAEHAAGGRTNREIAAALFVTERTVEANLTRVYRKLGVRSRTELARRL